MTIHKISSLNVRLLSKADKQWLAALSRQNDITGSNDVYSMIQAAVTPYDAEAIAVMTINAASEATNSYWQYYDTRGDASNQLGSVHL